MESLKRKRSDDTEDCIDEPGSAAKHSRPCKRRGRKRRGRKWNKKSKTFIGTVSAETADVSVDQTIVSVDQAIASATAAPSPKPVNRGELLGCLEVDLVQYMYDTQSPVLAGLPYEARQQFPYQFECVDFLDGASRFARLSDNIYAYLVLVYGNQVPTDTDERQTEDDAPLATFVGLMEGCIKLDVDNTIKEHTLDICRLDLITADGTVHFIHGDLEKTYHVQLAYTLADKTVSVLPDKMDNILPDGAAAGQVALRLPILCSDNKGFLARVVNGAHFNCLLPEQPVVVLV